MKIIRVNLTHSIENFIKYQKITSPLDHVGYQPLLLSDIGDLLIIRTSGNRVSAIGVITNKYFGNVDYYVSGRKIVDDKVLTVEVDVLKWIDIPTTDLDVEKTVWTCPWFSFPVNVTDSLIDKLNKLIK